MFARRLAVDRADEQSSFSALTANGELSQFFRQFASEARALRFRFRQKYLDLLISATQETPSASH